MELSNIQSKEICKYRGFLNYFIVYGSVLTSRSSSKTLTASSKCSSHLQIKYITQIKEYISRHSSTKPYCKWGGKTVMQSSFLYVADEIIKMAPLF